MNFDSITPRTRMLALAAMLAIQMTLIVSTIAPAKAHAAGPEVSTEPAVALPDSLLHTFGFGLSSGPGCSNLDGTDPKGSLTFANGFLFGRTSSTTGKGNGDGIVFQIDPAGTNYTIVHLFTGAKTDGNDPRHNAMTLDGTVLYGTTLTGGKHDTGTIFSINDDGTGYSTPPLFDFDKSQQKNNGDMPLSCFALSNGVLYGMTSEGGSKGAPTGDGTIFSFDPQTDTYTRLHSLEGKVGGSAPHGQPIFGDTNVFSISVTLYGMTGAGGEHKVGAIFSFDLSTKKFKTLHDFSCPHNATPSCIDASDGASPDHGTLVESGTTLFGLTTAGGKFGMGTIFSLQLTGKKKFKILHNFGNGTNDGQNPFGSLMLDGSTFYGTTRMGGTSGLGTVFQINTDGSNYARVHNFAGGTSDGANPIDDVILVNNTLYGMTEVGGKCNNGVIFAIALP